MGLPLLLVKSYLQRNVLQSSELPYTTLDTSTLTYSLYKYIFVPTVLYKKFQYYIVKREVILQVIQA